MQLTTFILVAILLANVVQSFELIADKRSIATGRGSFRPSKRQVTAQSDDNELVDAFIYPLSPITDDEAQDNQQSIGSHIAPSKRSFTVGRNNFRPAKRASTIYEFNPLFNNKRSMAFGRFRLVKQSDGECSSGDIDSVINQLDRLVPLIEIYTHYLNSCAKQHQQH